jgi:hypothetical protein
MGQRQKKTGNLLLSLVLLLTGIIACSGPEPDVPSGSVLFQDDFSYTAGGWDREQNAVYATDYDGGAYRIQVFEPNTEAWANPRLMLGDVRIEVDATKLAGPDDNIFGVLCRYQDARNFYFLAISSDGYVGIGVSKDGRRKLLIDDVMLPSSAVAQGDSTNHIRADCIGFELQLYVNGTLVAETHSAEWEDGDVGLLVGTYDQPGADISFDNFSVIKP